MSSRPSESQKAPTWKRNAHTPLEQWVTFGEHRRVNSRERQRATPAKIGLHDQSHRGKNGHVSKLAAGGYRGVLRHNDYEAVTDCI